MKETKGRCSFEIAIDFGEGNINLPSYIDFCELDKFVEYMAKVSKMLKGLSGIDPDSMASPNNSCHVIFNDNGELIK